MAGKPGTRPRDLPEPDWWARARWYRVQGMTYKQIAAACSKTKGAVENMFNRDKRNAAKRAQYTKQVPPRDRSHVDWMRTKARKEARHRWRTEGYAKSLDSYYRQLECL